MASGSSTANLPGVYIGPVEGDCKRAAIHTAAVAGPQQPIHHQFPQETPGGRAPAKPRVWHLDQQLKGDTIAIGDLPLCRVLLNDDGNYPWLILVPRREDLVELTDLDESGRTALMREIAQVSAALKAHTRCHKLNVAALGNVVAQLHVHIIARFRTDPAWPNPVWGKVKRIPREKEQRDRLVNAMRHALQIGALQG